LENVLVEDSRVMVSLLIVMLSELKLQV